MMFVVSRRVRRLVGVLVFAAVAFAAFGMSGAAQAHNGDESYVYLEVFDTELEGSLHLVISDLNEILGLDIPQDEEGAAAAANENLDVLHAYVEEHFALAAMDGTPWEVSYLDEASSLETRSGSYVILPFEVVQDFTEVPREFVIAYDVIIHEFPERAALLIIQTDYGSGTFKNEGSELLRFTADNTVQEVDLGDTSFWKGFAAVVGLGVEHIRIGSDHILFIFALVLPSVLVFSTIRGWEPSSSFGSSLWRVLKIVTVFTIAHSVTLALGGFGIIELSPALVETVIALSIALAALHNIRPVVFNKEWIIAGAFGLFHGLGFAGLLADLGLTQSRQVASLLAFNIGIELGQAAIILMVFPALFIARRTRAYLPFMYVGSVMLIIFAVGWALDRALGIDLLFVDAIVNRVLAWPRSLIVLAVVYAIAVALYYWDKSTDRLVPVYEGETSGEVETESVG